MVLVVLGVVLVVLEVLLELLETQNPFSKTFFTTQNPFSKTLFRILTRRPPLVDHAKKSVEQKSIFLESFFVSKSSKS